MGLIGDFADDLSDGSIDDAPTPDDVVDGLSDTASDYADDIEDDPAGSIGDVSTGIAGFGADWAVGSVNHAKKEAQKTMAMVPGVQTPEQQRKARERRKERREAMRERRRRRARQQNDDKPQAPSGPLAGIGLPIVAVAGLAVVLLGGDD